MIAAFARDDRGVAAVEFAIVSVFVMTAILNTVDVGAYVFEAMEVENAAQMAAQAALQNCTIVQVPVTTNCPNFASHVSTALASTSLGSGVTLQAGSPTEAYYCVNASSVLVQVGTLANRPSNCSAVGSTTTIPGDYVVISVRYTYAPIMPGASVVTLLQTPIVRRAIMRVA